MLTYSLQMRDILLFDEPLRELDEALKQQVIATIKPFIESKL